MCNDWDHDVMQLQTAPILLRLLLLTRFRIQLQKRLPTLMAMWAMDWSSAITQL